MSGVTITPSTLGLESSRVATSIARHTADFLDPKPPVGGNPGMEVSAIPELLARILGHLALRDVPAVRRACRQWSTARIQVQCAPADIARVVRRAIQCLHYDDPDGFYVALELVGPVVAARLITSGLHTKIGLFGEACNRGRLVIAQRLADDFDLTAADVRRGGSCALIWACANGHLAVAQWLADRFALTTEDACADDNSALLWACGDGHLAVVQWLVDHFGLTASARSESSSALCDACKNGHLETAQWLADHFLLTTADVRGCGNKTLWWVFKNCNLAVAQWLIDRFELTATDVCEGGVGPTLRWASLSDHNEKAQWLADRFGLIFED